MDGSSTTDYERALENMLSDDDKTPAGRGGGGFDRARSDEKGNLRRLDSSSPPLRGRLSIMGEDEPGHTMPQGYRRIDQNQPENTDFITIDWFTDREAARRAKRQFRARNAQRNKFVGVVSNWYHNVQGWVVLFLVGVATALTGSVIHQTAGWLGSMKFGYCTEHGFWVSRTLCCLESSTTVCEAWSNWSEIMLPHNARGTFWFDYFVYVVMGVTFALVASFVCATFSPLSLGSGISGTKVVLGGFVIRKFLSGATLLIKSLGLILAVASGLSLGLQGPMVHIACCWGAIFVRLFPKYKTNEAMKREIYSASAAAGVTAAFGAPLGGVLFSLEAMSSYFPHKTMWRSFWCAITTAVMIRYFNPYSGTSSTARLVQFQVFYRGESWMWYELAPFTFLGVLGGLGGALFIRINAKLHEVRRGVPWFRENRFFEIALISLVSCIMAFSNVFASEGQSFLLEHLFSHCTELKVSLPDRLTDALCSEGTDAWRFMLLLMAAALGRFILTIVTFGAQVPSGLFMPTLCVGACVGRLVGWTVTMWHLSVGDDQWPFKGCMGRTDCIFPSLYAVVGAAAFLAGTTRLTVSLAVIMLELTGGLDYIVPLMVAVVPAKWVGDAFGKEGIFDKLISLQGYPHINPNMELDSEAKAADLMSRNVVMLSKHHETLASVEDTFSKHSYHGFPIVESERDRRVVGFITRRDLETALMDNEDISPSTLVAFDSEGLPGRLVDYIDLTAYVDKHPVIVRPTMPADRVLDMFKGLGLRIIFVCDKTGNLSGVIKKKDMLKHMQAERIHARSVAQHGPMRGIDQVRSFTQELQRTRQLDL